MNSRSSAGQGQVETLPAEDQRKLAEAFDRSRQMKTQWRLFAREYVRDFRAGDAAKRAGFTPAYASTLLAIPEVRAEIEELEAEILFEARRKAGVSLHRTLAELAKLAYFDPGKLFNEDGSPKGIHELAPAERAAIQGIEVEERWEGRGEERQFVGFVRKIKIANKQQALETLLRHLGGFKEDNNQAGEAAGKAVLAGVAGLLQAIQGQGSALGVVKRPPPDADVVDV